MFEFSQRSMTSLCGTSNLQSLTILNSTFQNIYSLMKGLICYQTSTNVKFLYNIMSNANLATSVLSYSRSSAISNLSF